MADEDKPTPADKADDSVESELVTDENEDTPETPEADAETPEAEKEVVEEDPTPELTEPDFPAQIADLTERINTQQSQIEALTDIVSRLQEENADLIDSLPAAPEAPQSTESSGDDFIDELFN